MASCLTMSDAEPVQLVEKKPCKMQCVLEDSSEKVESLLENSLCKTKRKSKILIYPEKFQGKVFTK